MLGAEAEDYSAALSYFELNHVNWLCCPTAETDTQATAVATWVEEQREERNKIKAVLPNTEADNEGVVNYTTESVTVGEKTYTAEKFCSRVCGSFGRDTFSAGSDVLCFNRCGGLHQEEKAELDAAIDAGEFVLFYDGEKVKVARAVNSLTTVSEEKTDAWKKIKVVETMDMMHDDLVMLVEDNYIGNTRTPMIISVCF